MSCEYCKDPNGESCYPIYGLGPHHHDLSKTGGIIGSTVYDASVPLPDNFVPDPEDERMGTYYCPYCKEEER